MKQYNIKKTVCFLLYLICISFVLSLHAETIEGTVDYVYDGDTVSVKTKSGTQKVRLSDIDAPESTQDGGKESSEALNDKVKNKHVRVYVDSRDDYGRAVGRVYTDDGTDIGKEIVREGHAYHYKQYSKDSSYTKAEEKAKKNNSGVWKNHKSKEKPQDYRICTREDKASHTKSQSVTSQNTSRHNSADTTRSASSGTSHSDTTTVRGYYRSDGTYVRGYTRCTPSSRSRENNSGRNSYHSNSSSSGSSSGGNTVHVKGYYRSDGTYVKGYTRRAPSKK